MKSATSDTAFKGRLPDVGAEMKSALLRSFGTNGHSRADMYGRVIARVPRVDPFVWLRSQTAPEKFYWRGRGGSDSLAGIGSVTVIEGTEKVRFDELRTRVAGQLELAPAGARFFGGMRFDPNRVPANGWEGLPAYRFVLPRLELRQSEAETLLVCNFGPGESLDEVLNEIEQPNVAAGTLYGGGYPALASCAYLPDFKEWRRAVEWALSAFSRTTLAKVVLARVTRLLFAEEVDPIRILRDLRSATPNCYHFLFATSGLAFVGASPERLFRLEDRRFTSEAVAGTRPRGETAGADALLRDELLHSEKDQREHEYVRQSLKESLTDVTRILQVDTMASEMKLAAGRHLVSRVDGVLKDGVDAFDLLRRLHPTPAVGGYPNEESMDVIANLEPFDRGYYAGPIGWLARDSAEFAVAIRSGLVRGASVDLYSGAGIVCGSDPELEWLEVDQKIGDFLRVLGLGHGC